VARIREDLTSVHQPVAIGGSHRFGQFEIWVTVDAPDRPGG